jgi:predicted RNA-binding protein YlqC (UPF0109 family)
MKDLTKYLVSEIVSHPESVVVDETEDQYGRVVLSITVDPADIGQVIGKQGRIIRSIRDVVKILAVKQNKLVDVTVVEQQ